MYLHFVDDKIPINHLIIRANEMFPGDHRFYVISNTGLLHKVIKAGNVIPFVASKPNIENVVQELKDYKAVFIHNLCHVKAQIVIKASDSVFFIWGIWGFDYYYVFPRLYRNIFLPWTIGANYFLLKHYLIAKRVLYTLHPLTKLFGIKSLDRLKIKATKKIHFTFNNLGSYSEVFQFLEIEPGKRFKGIYYSVDSITGPLKSEDGFRLGENIYIGNSASNSSNHIDLFIKLKKIKIGHRKILVPLSYGCPRYRMLVNFTGRFLFKQNYFPLNDFLKSKKS